MRRRAIDAGEPRKIDDGAMGEAQFQDSLSNQAQSRCLPGPERRSLARSDVPTGELCLLDWNWKRPGGTAPRRDGGGRGGRVL
jgi:hypothetical protein